MLFSNPGGPGTSGVDFILKGDGAPAFERLRERFDIVSFDVRGSHRSRAVRCEVEPAGDPANLDDATLVAFFDTSVAGSPKPASIKMVHSFCR